MLTDASYFAPQIPSSSVRSFDDPDEFVSAIRKSGIQLTITGSGRFEARIIRVELYKMWMQRITDNLPRIAHVNGLETRAVIAFPINSGANLTWNGFDTRSTNIMRYKPGAETYHRTMGPNASAAMSLPLDCMESIGGVLAGANVLPPNEPSIATPKPAAMDALRRLHAAAGYLAETAPEVIANPESARGLEQSLISAMVACVASGEIAEERSASRRHAQIMRRFYKAIEEQPDRALYMPEICLAVGVAERTLRMCCQEYLGTSPKQFLLARRMMMARRDLRLLTQTETTVTEIASKYGFWDFGHFAGAYKAQFAELPSQTLKRRPG